MFGRLALLSLGAHHHTQIIVGFRVIGPHFQGPNITVCFLFPVFFHRPYVSHTRQEKGLRSVPLANAAGRVPRRVVDPVEGPLG